MVRFDSISGLRGYYAGSPSNAGSVPLPQNEILEERRQVQSRSLEEPALIRHSFRSRRSHSANLFRPAQLLRVLLVWSGFVRHLRGGLFQFAPHRYFERLDRISNAAASELLAARR